jgi:hypothetical protein
MKGLEPSHLAVLEPKSSASANSATSASVFNISITISGWQEVICQKSEVRSQEFFILDFGFWIVFVDSNLKSKI